MRIACLQFAPILGDLDNNLNRADSVLDEADPQDLDLLVLPELAFSGKSMLTAGKCRTRQSVIASKFAQRSPDV